MSTSLFAADRYDPNLSYNGGSTISFNGDIYQAKWWANKGQSPADKVAHEWETPWELISKGDGVTPVTPVTPPTEPDKPVVDGYPQYLFGTAYKGGDIVNNDGKLYQCREGVTVPWCSGAAWAYAPGSGSAWFDAWVVWNGTDPVKPVVPIKPDPVKPDPVKPDPVKPDPVKPDPVKPDPVKPDPVKPGDKYQISRAALEAKEAALTNSDLMKAVKSSVRTLDNVSVEAIRPLADTNPDNVKRVESIITSDDWAFLFPKRSPEYTYLNFLKATGKFPAFCGNYDDGRDADAICRKALTTMFAHFTQETGGHTAHWEVPEWRQGLVHVREMGWDENQRGGYNGECKPDTWQGQTWPCGKFSNGEYKSYFGRGSKQLSYNYNYGPFSDAIFGTVQTLLDNPEMVADTWLNLASAVFFYIYPQPPKPSMLHVVDGSWVPNGRDLANGLTSGFGATTQIINGGVECGGSTEIAQSRNRIAYYTEFANYLSVPLPNDEVLGCAGMKQFDAQGAGALALSWEQDWSWNKDTPNNKSYACQLKNYQTPFSALKAGDYEACVKHFFPDVVVTD